MVRIEIDKHSGFCFGVINAIQTAEEYLSKHHVLYCLGDIVHNNEELKRLSDLGLSIISHREFELLRNTTVLIRAHGEPPETYVTAQKNNVSLIDATCPVVLNLQKRIKDRYENFDIPNEQILIFGKKGHAEVIGLLGQAARKGIVLSTFDDIVNVNFDQPAVLYSQTTQSLEEYSRIISLIKSEYEKRGKSHLFSYHDTICRLVANRSRKIREFASRFDKIIFVSGEKSSNGLYLFELCKQVNQNSHFISKPEHLSSISITADESIGICGATSTPMWLMQKVKEILLLQTEKKL